MSTYFQTCVRYIVDGGITEYADLSRSYIDSLLVHHFEDRKSVIDEAYLEEFLCESLVSKTSTVFDVLLGNYTGITDAIRDYSAKHNILEELWNAEVLRLEAERSDNIAGCEE